MRRAVLRALLEILIKTINWTVKYKWKYWGREREFPQKCASTYCMYLYLRQNIIWKKKSWNQLAETNFIKNESWGEEWIQSQVFRIYLIKILISFPCFLSVRSCH
jgi:hypothetical protein